MYSTCAIKLLDVLLTAALVEGTIFCMHGGLSPNLKSFEQVHHFHSLMLSKIKPPLHQLVCARCKHLYGVLMSNSGKSHSAAADGPRDALRPSCMSCTKVVARCDKLARVKLHLRRSTCHGEKAEKSTEFIIKS